MLLLIFWLKHYILDIFIRQSPTKTSHRTIHFSGIASTIRIVFKHPHFPYFAIWYNKQPAVSPFLERLSHFFLLVPTFN